MARELSGLREERFRAALDELFAEAPVRFPAVLECFEELCGAQHQHQQVSSEEYFRLFSQLHYVVQRNTKEECVQQLIPRHGLSARWAALDDCEEEDDDKTVAERRQQSRGDCADAMAERRALQEANERVLSEMRDAVSALQRETEALESRSQELDAAIAATDAAVQSSAEPFRALRTAVC